MNNRNFTIQSSFLSYFTLIIASILLIVFSSCNQNNNHKEDTTNSIVPPKEKEYKGTLNIGADVSVENIIKQQAEIFHHLHDKVDVNETYKNENELIAAFKKEELQVIVLSRNLNDLERNQLRIKDTIYPREILVAYDAVAILGNNAFDDSRLTEKQLQDIVVSNNSDYKIVFNKNNSSLLNFVLSKVANTTTLNNNMFGLDNEAAVIDYVSKNKNAIGFVAYSLISDTDDEKINAMVSKVKILNLRVKNEEGKWVKAAANQNDIAEGNYPLIRNIYAISKFSYDDNLEWLFMNFLFKEKGAKIFLKAGLMPAKMPERHITVSTGALESNK